MKHTKCYQRNYPRPQFVRKSFYDLTGKWYFSFDDGNLGEKEQWFKKDSLAQTIIVPYSYHTKASQICDLARHDVVWYAKKLDINKSDIMADERLIINFEGSDYFTKVWVNGIFVGENVGGYHRFSFDVTDCLNGDNNFISVRVEDNFDTDIVRGKQRWQNDSFACFYTETTGIWKSVWAEKISKNHLCNAKITPNVDDSKVNISYEFNGIAENLSIQTIISFNDVVICDYENKVLRKKFCMDFSLVSEVNFFKVVLWQTYAPQLYDVKFIVKQGDKVIDEVGSYFGFRKVESVKSSLNINNRPEYLKMVLDQAYYPDSDLTAPDEESIIKDIMLIKDLGFNGIRKHQKIEDDRFYYYCDILGMFVFLEMPSNYEFTQIGMQNFTKEWMLIVSQHYNFASIICYVPFNESWGVFDIYNNKNQQSFTESIYFLTKSFDSTRLVISNDGWEHTKSDIISLHNYVDKKEDIELCYSDKNKILDNEFISPKVPKYAFCKGYKYEGQPVMISEYAGVAFQKDKEIGWGYGNLVKSEDEFLTRLEDLTSAIKNLPYMMGYCITQFTDIKQEVNGLFDINRVCKVKDYDRLKKIFA